MPRTGAVKGDRREAKRNIWRDRFAEQAVYAGFALPLTESSSQPEATGRALQEAMRWRSHARDFSAREGVAFGCCGVSPQVRAGGWRGSARVAETRFRPGGSIPYMMSKPSERVRPNTIKSGRSTKGEKSPTKAGVD